MTRPNRAATAILAMSLIFIGSAATRAEPAKGSGAWAAAPLSKARLVAAGGLDRETATPLYRLGLDLSLEGKAHTYWRMPGDAGVPPKISFEGSRNLAAGDLSFPLPQRLDEAGLQVFGYTGAVLLPLDVRPKEAGKPVHVAVTLDFAACEKICIPAQVRLTIDLDPKAAPGAEATRLAEARSLLPRPIANGEAGLRLDIVPGTAGGKPVWHVRAKEGGPLRDLFVEAPDGWYLEARKTDAGFDLVAADAPKAPAYPLPVTLTLAGARAFEMKVALTQP